MTNFEKTKMRKLCARNRSLLKRETVDEQIKENFVRSVFFRFSVFFVYASYSTEVDTWGLLNALFAADKQVCLPRIEGEKMVSARYQNGAPCVCNRYGICEPQGEEAPCEVAVVPLLAFDEKGGRLGYGGGYYDKYFQAFPHVLRVGYAYSGQRVEAVPVEEHDVFLDAVVTEEGVFIFSDRAREQMKKL